MHTSLSSFGGHRPLASSFILVTTAFITFNGAIWQLMRRRWKQRLIDSYDNMQKPMLRNAELPRGNESFGEFSRVELSGLMDNEGAFLVGPRPMPSSRQALESSSESRRGGFMVMTPLECDGTGQVVMINRGWVPIDACKSRVQRVQYTGAGIVPMKNVHGVIRTEEWVSTLYGGDSHENHSPAYIGKYWTALRPFDQAIDYFKRRFGENSVEDCKKRYGVQHWYVEMVEDHSGNDQILIADKVYPMRRTQADLGRANITPFVHLMYACFWFFVSGGCCFLLRRMWGDALRGRQAARLANRAAEVLSARRNAEALRMEHEMVSLMSAVQGGRVSDIRMAAVSDKDRMNTTTTAFADSGAAAAQKAAMGVVPASSPYAPPTYVGQQQQQQQHVAPAIGSDARQGVDATHVAVAAATDVSTTTTTSSPSSSSKAKANAEGKSRSKKKSKNTDSASKE